MHKISLLEQSQQDFSKEKARFLQTESQKNQQIKGLEQELKEKTETCNELIKLLKNIGDAVGDCSRKLSPSRPQNSVDFSAVKIKDDLYHIYSKIIKHNEDKSKSAAPKVPAY